MHPETDAPAKVPEMVIDWPLVPGWLTKRLITLMAPLPPVEIVKADNAEVLASVIRLLAGDDTYPVLVMPLLYVRS